MIQTLLLVGTPLLLLVWLAGLPNAWKGRPKLALWASGLGVGLGVLAAMSGIAGPRHSNFWTGDAGSGDGFGLIGLFVLGGAVAGASLIFFMITAAVATARGAKANQEVSE